MRTHKSGECVKQGRVRERESEERWRMLFGVAFVEEEQNRATEVEAEVERWLGFEEGEKWRVRKRLERESEEREEVKRERKSRERKNVSVVKSEKDA